MNIYVGNLNFKTTEEELGAHFEQYGPVSSVKIISDRYSGQSRGFGFVEMEKKEDGEKAVSELNGKDFAGRDLKINEAHQR